MDNNINLRRYIVWGVVVFVLLLTLNWLFHYLTTGTITVMAGGSQNTVTIVSANEGHGNTFYRQALNRLSIKVRPGNYVISAQGHTATINKTIVLHARQRLAYTLTPPPVAAPEPVMGSPTTDVASDSSQLYYIDPSGSGLYRINDQNKLELLGNNISIQTVKWVYAGYGIGQAYDGNLYVINGANLTQLKTPPDFAINKKVNYAVVASRQIYLSIDRAIYSGDDGGHWQKIYTAPSAPTQILPSPASGNIGFITISKGGSQNMAIINPRGKLLKSASINGSAVTWSPDGKLLSVRSTEGFGGEILDSSLSQVVSLANSDKTDTWLNNNTLIYGTVNMLWSYDLRTKNSVLIASLPSGDSINDVSLDKDHHYIYLATQNSNGVAELDRISLSGQKSLDVVYELDAFFPKTVSGCYVNYVNFTAPALLVSTEPDDTSCPQKVENEVINDRLNAKVLQINYTNLPINVNQG